MRFSVPRGYVRSKPVVRPKLDPFVLIIDKILADDKARPKKQQHTAKRIFERLRDEHAFTGGITIVKDYVAGVQQRSAEMVPVPVFDSFAALNMHLADCCRKRLGEVLRGETETIGVRLQRDLAAFRQPLPRPYDACEKIGTRVSSLSLVRYRSNDYSVPTSFGHRDVLLRGYVHEVVIACGTEIIARHPRSYEREDFVFDPLHYLALIERKINALDQAAPLADWNLPDEFATLRRLLEARMGSKGKREFVQVLRLMETFTIDDVAAAVRDAIQRGAVGFDAVKHLVLCRIERRPPRLDMTIYPYLPKATVATTSARAYMELLAGAVS
jgi:hypothetical protein